MNLSNFAQSFLFENNQLAIQTLNQLVMLENAIQRGKFSQKEVLTMVEIYNRVIKYCQEIMNPLKAYFQKKLSCFLLNDKIIHKLMTSESRSETNIERIKKNSWKDF